MALLNQYQVAKQMQMTHVGRKTGVPTLTLFGNEKYASQYIRLADPARYMVLDLRAGYS
jgi:hypothetical protein